MLRQLPNSTNRVLPQNIPTTLLLPIKPLCPQDTENTPSTEKPLHGCGLPVIPQVSTSFLSWQLAVQLLNLHLGIISISFYRLRLLGGMNSLLHQIT